MATHLSCKDGLNLHVSLVLQLESRMDHLLSTTEVFAKGTGKP